MNRQINEVSVIFICLQDYYLFFERFHDSCEKLFLRGINKKYFVISDVSREEFSKEGVTWCKVKTPKHKNKKGRRVPDKRRIKLNKFVYVDQFWNQIGKSDYIFYFDADTIIKKSIRIEDIIDESKGLVGVVHGFGSVRRGSGRKGVRFEGDPKSAAYLDPKQNDLSTYYQSCLWGGYPNDIRAMVDDLNLWIQKDLEIGHKNKHSICDEVYVNKYFVLNKNNLNELDDRYSCPAEGMAYRKKREYSGTKEIIISHECCHQTNTIRQFMNTKSNDKSIAFHFNGKAVAQYMDKDSSGKLRASEKLLELDKVRAQNSKKTFDFSKCDVLTFDNTGTTGMLFDSCKELGVPLINMGEPKKFEKLKSKYVPEQKWGEASEATNRVLKLKNNFLLMHKLFAIYEQLKNNSRKKYFFFFDQTDVSLVDSPSERLDLFESKDCGMLFNAETRCMYFPMIHRTADNYSDLNKYFAPYGDVKEFEEKLYGDGLLSGGVVSRYLNSGAFVSNSDYYLDWFEKHKNFLFEFIHLNDQTVMHHFHFMYHPEIQIDHKCEIFQCMGPHKKEFNL